MAVETIHGVALVSSLKKTTKLMVYFLSIIKQKYHILNYISQTVITKN